MKLLWLLFITLKLTLALPKDRIFGTQTSQTNIQQLGENNAVNSLVKVSNLQGTLGVVADALSPDHGVLSLLGGGTAIVENSDNPPKGILDLSVT